MAKTNEQSQGQKGKQKFIQFSDIVIIFVFCLGMLLFILMTWQKVNKIASPKDFNTKVTALINGLAGDEIPPVQLPEYAKDTIERFGPPRMATSEGNDLSNEVYSGITTHVFPGIVIKIPLPGEETIPVTGLELVPRGSSEGNFVIKWVAAKNEQCKQYRVRWWRMSSFSGDDYKRIEIRNNTEFDPNKFEGEKLVDVRTTTTTIEGISPNEEYIIDVQSMTVDKEPCVYQEAIENTYIAGVISPGEEKEMPQPSNFRVEKATLAGIELRWDNFARIYDVKKHPDIQKIMVALYRWKEGEEDQKVMLNPPDDANPFGTMFNYYLDLDIEPDVPYYYAVQYYHVESYPTWNNKEVNYLYDELLKLRIPDVDERSGKVKTQGNKPVWIEREVFASKLYKLSEPIVLKDKPVVVATNIYGSPNPDNKQSYATVELTVYKSLPIPENPSESKFVRVKVELTVKYGDMLAGSTNKPISIDGEEFNRNSRYGKLLKEKNITIDFSTPLKVVGIYSIDYKYQKGSTDVVMYIELQNTDPEYADCWPFKVYRQRDVKAAQEIRDKEDNGEIVHKEGDLRKMALIPNNPEDKQRGMNPDERKEMMQKIIDFANEHGQDEGWYKDKTYKFTREFEDYLWEFLIANEVRFYTNSFLNDFPILKKWDQLRKMD